MPKDKQLPIFELHTWISNNGDGSASLQIEDTADAAAKADEDQQENGEGWGESCNGSVELRINDGVIERKTHDYIKNPEPKKKGQKNYSELKYVEVWKPLALKA